MIYTLMCGARKGYGLSQEQSLLLLLRSMVLFEKGEGHEGERMACKEVPEALAEQPAVGRSKATVPKTS